MLASYAIGVLVIVAALVVWLAVQIAWGKVFPGASCDPDVLARRAGCRACDSTEVCDRRLP